MNTKKNEFQQVRIQSNMEVFKSRKDRMKEMNRHQKITGINLTPAVLGKVPFFL